MTQTSSIWRRDASLVVSSCVIVALIVGMLLGAPALHLVGAALFLLIAGTYAALLHPSAILRLLAFTLAAVPLMPMPGLGVPVFLLLGIAVWVAVLVRPGQSLHFGAVEIVIVILGIAGLISVVATGLTHTAFSEYGRWLIATAVVIPMRRFTVRELATFGRTYVIGACAGGFVGIFLVFFDSSGRILASLGVLGYDPKGGNARVVVGSTFSTLRLTGTYVDPNLAGIMLVVGLVLAVALFHGPWRTVIVLLLGLAIALTLSRTALGTVFASAVLLLLFGRIGRRFRRRVLLGLAAAVVVALSLVPVRSRLFDTFGPTDTGSLARREALDSFVSSMQGHWYFGQGWGIEEFHDATVAATANYVANAPLLTIYRAGTFVGIAFVMMLICGVFLSVRQLRGGSWPGSVVGAGFIAFVVVALQLDFPVVILSPATMAFGILLGFVAHPQVQDVADLVPRRRPVAARTKVAA
jgi:hypothetical protein